MNKGYLRSLLQYLSSVYDIGGKIKKLKDKRSNPKITTAAIAFSVLLGFMLKIRSFNQLDDWLEHDDLRRIVPRLLKLDGTLKTMFLDNLKPRGIWSIALSITKTDWRQLLSL